MSKNSIDEKNYTNCDGCGSKLHRFITQHNKSREKNKRPKNKT